MTRPSMDEFLGLQHGFKDQLWLIQRDQALLFETHVHKSSISLDPHGSYHQAVSSGQISAETEATQTLIVMEL